MIVIVVSVAAAAAKFVVSAAVALAERLLMITLYSYEYCTEANCREANRWPNVFASHFDQIMANYSVLEFNYLYCYFRIAFVIFRKLEKVPLSKNAIGALLPRPGISEKKCSTHNYNK